MQTACASEIQFGAVSGHRTGKIEFLRLLQGIPATPDNFELSVVRTQGDYFTPRHRHNFDQVRFCLDGTMNYAPGKDLARGAVGYFPEGTFYGPQADVSGSLVMVLQMGGAAGYGFMSYQQLNAGFEELRKEGDFEKGAFSYRDDAGRWHRKDGYEAVWERINNRAVEYPPPRYEEPIVMHPDAFNWTPAGPGLRVKRLGSFGERGLALGMIEASRGLHHTVGALEASELLFIARGSLRANGKILDAHSALRLDRADEGATIEALENTEVFFIQMPKFPAAMTSTARAA